MPDRIPQGVVYRAELIAYQSADHVTPSTGRTIAVTISKNGGAFANPSGGATNATEVGSGAYYVDLSTSDTDTLGPLLVKGTEGTIDTIFSRLRVVAPSLRKNVAFSNFLFYMTDSVTHTPKTGLGDGDFTLKKCTIDSGAPTTIAGTITQVSAANQPGLYRVTLSAAELNGNNVALEFQATGTDATLLTIVTQ